MPDHNSTSAQRMILGSRQRHWRRQEDRRKAIRRLGWATKKRERERDAKRSEGAARAILTTTVMVRRALYLFRETLLLSVVVSVQRWRNCSSSPLLLLLGSLFLPAFWVRSCCACQEENDFVFPLSIDSSIIHISVVSIPSLVRQFAIELSAQGRRWTQKKTSLSLRNDGKISSWVQQQQCAIATLVKDENCAWC